MRPRDPELRSRLAAEYVLGTLAGAARRRFGRWLRSDPALRGEVDAWEARLFGLLDVLPPREPPPHVWEAIRNRVAPAPLPVARPGLWESLAFWRGAAAMAAVLAVVLAVLLGRPAPPPVPGTPDADRIAVVADAEQRGAWLVRWHADETRLAVRALSAQDLPSGRSFELWVLPGGDAAPRSLGLIAPVGETALVLAPDLAAGVAAAPALAVSLEPAGGSPTGAPTGPVLYSGALERSP